MGEKLQEKQRNSLQSCELELLQIHYFFPSSTIIHETQAEDKKVQNRKKLVVSLPPANPSQLIR